MKTYKTKSVAQTQATKLTNKTGVQHFPIKTVEGAWRVIEAPVQAERIEKTTDRYGISVVRVPVTLVKTTKDFWMIQVAGGRVERFEKKCGSLDGSVICTDPKTAKRRGWAA